MKVTSIRFNLKFFNADGSEEVVRTLDDLRVKFNLCDLWDYFKSGDLVKWLKSINEPDLAERVGGLTSICSKQTAMSKICATLNLTTEDDNILELSEILDRQEMTEGRHKKIETLRQQEQTGEIHGSEIYHSFVGSYYFDSVNILLETLDKFTYEDFGNIEKLRAFEQQKFVPFINHYGGIFARDLIISLKGDIHNASDWSDKSSKLLILSLFLVDKRFHEKYDRYLNFIGNPFNTTTDISVSVGMALPPFFADSYRHHAVRHFPNHLVFSDCMYSRSDGIIF